MRRLCTVLAITHIFKKCLVHLWKWHAILKEQCRLIYFFFFFCFSLQSYENDMLYLTKNFFFLLHLYRNILNCFKLILGAFPHRGQNWHAVTVTEVLRTIFCLSTSGIVCWLERRTRDQKVASSNPGRSGGRFFFSRVNFVCWLIRCPFHPRVTTVTR